MRVGNRFDLGKRWHRRQGRGVYYAGHLRIWAAVLLLVGMVVICLAFAAWKFGILVGVPWVFLIASVATGIVFCAFVLWLLGGWLREESGLPGGFVLFSDTGYERLASFSMVSHRLGLVGKPDFLIKTPDGVVPVECKSSLVPVAGPYWNHIVQLGVYLLLVEEHYGWASYGVINYRDGSVKVEFTRGLRTSVLRLLSELKRSQKLDVAAVRRSHDSAARCRGCGYVDVCDEAIM